MESDSILRIIFITYMSPHNVLREFQSCDEIFLAHHHKSLLMHEKLDERQIIPQHNFNCIQQVQKAAFVN
ncbi:CLUMA_CG010643, isoform A [Clunio marinus]|uniref:CLUMA_CG010643, isoform A n=1 Tax=Clunio marinus TaxID=568069 RepID=A0A1J1IAD6_9DIPT|nr:CLUMA_CG010643, isoform A [Clunio marinus]